MSDFEPDEALCVRCNKRPTINRTGICKPCRERACQKCETRFLPMSAIEKHCRTCREKNIQDDGSIDMEEMTCMVPEIGGLSP